MSDETSVYDLGELERAPAAAKRDPQIRAASGIATAAPAAAPAPAVARTATVAPSVRPIDAITDSLELFVPGTGQLLRGRWSDGLSVLAGVGFLLALAWAIWETLDRLAGTLTALGYTAAGGIYALAMIYVCLAMLHAGNVLFGTTRGPERAHPIVAGVASALIPGWGQLINRQPAKAAAFVTGLWIVGIVWLLASPSTVALFDAYGLTFRPRFELFSKPVVLWTAPIVLWALSVYDAVATSRR